MLLFFNVLLIFRIYLNSNSPHRRVGVCFLKRGFGGNDFLLKSFLAEFINNTLKL